MRSVAAAISAIRISGAALASIGIAVVLGDPVARVAEPLGEAREVDRVAERVGARVALGDRRLVEDAEL